MRKVLFFGSLTVVAVLFVALLLNYFMKQRTVVNEQVNITQESTPAPVLTGDVVLSLKPQTATGAVGEDVSFDIIYGGLTTSIVSSDVILDYNSELLEFVGVEGVDENYQNIGTFVRENRVILTFTQKLNAPDVALSSAQDFVLGKVVFKLRQNGTTSIVPFVDGSAKSSMVFLKDDSLTNQLGAVYQAEVVIN